VRGPNQPEVLWKHKTPEGIEREVLRVGGGAAIGDIWKGEGRFKCSAKGLTRAIEWCHNSYIWGSIARGRLDF